MILHLNESKFRNILTEMVREVLLLMEATPLEIAANQCKDIIQTYFSELKNEHKTLDTIYTRFKDTYFHGNSNNIVGKLSPIFLHLVWYFHGLFGQYPIQQDKMFLSKVKEMIHTLSMYANNKNTQYQDELNNIKNCIKQCIEQISNGNQINTDELPVSKQQKKVINKFLVYYNQLVRQNNQPNNLDVLIDQKIQGSGVQYPIIDEIYNKYKLFTINTTNNLKEIPQYEELFTFLETKCNEAKKEINTTTTINNSETTTNNNNNNNIKYELIKIENIEEAWQYGQYSGGYTIENGNVKYNGQLCFTNNPGMWNTFTNNKTNTCYLLLDKGLSQNPNIYCTEELSGKSSDNPYDDYGMSMIFLFVTPEGELYRSNTRWNHRADYSTYGKSCDNAFTKEDIQRLISTEVYKNIFTDGLVDKINDLNNGEALENVFNVDGEVNGYTIIEYKNKYNLVYYDKDNVLQSPWYLEHFDLWFKKLNVINNRYIILNYGCYKYNIFDTHNNMFIINSKYIRGWFDEIVYVNKKGNNLFWIRKKNKENYLGLDNNGELECLFGDINNIDEWFDRINKKGNNLFWIRKNFKENFLVPDGNGGYKLVYGDINNIDTWFDEIDTDNNSFRVYKNGKYNYLVPDKVNGSYKLVYGDINNIDTWFDNIDKEDNLFWVYKNGKKNYLVPDGNGGYKLVYGDINNTNTWFDRIIEVHNLFKVYKNDKQNYLVPDGNGGYKLVYGDINNIDTWFDNIEKEHNLFRVYKNGKKNYLVQDKVNGSYKLVYGDINNTNTWFDGLTIIDNYLIKIRKLNKQNYLVQDKVNGSYKLVYGDINNIDTWFDNILKINNDLFRVEKNYKDNCLLSNGNGVYKLVYGDINNTDEWFYNIYKNDDDDSFVVQKSHDDNENYLVPDGNGGYKLITPDEYQQYRNQQNQPLNEIINRLVRNYIRY